MESRSSTIRSQGCHNRLLPTIMKTITIIAIIIIIYNLARHPLSVIRAFEAQVPENIVNTMQYLLVE